MFTSCTKNFGVWKEERNSNKIIYCLMSTQFVFALSIMAFVIWLTFVIVVKIRQEFFLIESAPITLIKDGKIDKNFFITERNSAITVFIKKEKNNSLNIYFENGESFSLPKESKVLVEYLKNRKRNIIYFGMVLRINSEKNSRIKVWTEKNISFEDIKTIINIFSQYGFDSFDFAVERADL